MLIRKTGDLRYSEITPKSVYLNRRRFLAAAPAAFLAARAARGATTKLAVAAKSPFSTSEPITSPNVVERYNNFYEFGTGKDEPAETRRTSRPRRGPCRWKALAPSRASSPWTRS